MPTVVALGTPPPRYAMVEQPSGPVKAEMYLRALTGPDNSSSSFVPGRGREGWELQRAALYKQLHDQVFDDDGGRIVAIFETLVGLALSVLLGLAAGWGIAAVIRYIKKRGADRRAKIACLMQEPSQLVRRVGEWKP